MRNQDVRELFRFYFFVLMGVVVADVLGFLQLERY